jgi:hypothetical protein
MIKPNVAVKWLAILFQIWEVLGSNLAPKISYPEVFLGFPVLPGKYSLN